MKTRAIYEGGMLKLRGMLDLRDGEEVEVLVRSSRPGLEERVRRLEEYLTTNIPEPFVSPSIRNSTWYARDYSLRKLGLREY
jgi:predicted DNA-binding antitoxin AbrB/MazE fold protein